MINFNVKYWRLNRYLSNICKQFDFIGIEEKLYEHLTILFEES